MTTHKGNSGVVRVGGTPTVVAEMKSWSLTETISTVEDTAMGDSAKTFVSDDLPTWTASINCHFYPGDTNGQATLLVGASITMEFGSEGTTTGKNKRTGTGIITSRQEGEVTNAQIVPLTIQVQGTGALTRATYA
jgi:hypothetical protein